jgi:hypothetical protein
VNPYSRIAMPLVSAKVEMSSQEKRVSMDSRRVEIDLRCPAVVQSALHSGVGTIFNLSQGGIYVSTSMSMLPQAHVYIHLPLPEKRRFLKLEALAIWNNRGERQVESLPPGHGFRFINLSANAKLEIQTLLENRKYLRKSRPASPTKSLVEPDRLLANMLPSYGWGK